MEERDFQLHDGSRVGVIGGGPAGSFFSFFLLDTAKRVDLDIHVDIYEPRDFLPSWSNWMQYVWGNNIRVSRADACHRRNHSSTHRRTKRN